MSRYDTFWPRFFALIIDGFALSILTGVLALIPATESRPLSMIINLIHTSLVYVYSIVMIGRYGQTLGKMAMSIKVVDNDTEEKVTYNQAFKREAVPIFWSSFLRLAHTLFLVT